MQESKLYHIAFYLPQFHEIPENNKYWGKGFTEWTNVKRAKKLFKGHEQPKIPGRLGYYNLLDTNIRKKQAEFAKNIGIDAFCYWHYFFGKNKIVLDEPLQLMLKDREPNLPFMLAWANESWTGIWHGLENETILEQTYNKQDINWHINYLLPFLKSPNHLILNNKIPIIIYRPNQIPYLNELMNKWNKIIKKEIGLELMFIGYHVDVPVSKISIINERYFWGRIDSLVYFLFFQKFSIPYKKSYKKMLNRFLKSKIYPNQYPVIYTNWDNTPRLGKKGFMFKDYSKALFNTFLNTAKKKQSNVLDKLIFIKSWNEWAEGNYLEPELKDGQESFIKIRKDL